MQKYQYHGGNSNSKSKGKFTFMLVPTEPKYITNGIHPAAIRKTLNGNETPNADAVDLIFSQLVFVNHSSTKPGTIIPHGIHLDTAQIPRAKLATLLDQERLAECDLLSSDTHIEPADYFVVLVTPTQIKFISPVYNSKIAQIAPKLAKYCRPYANAITSLQTFYIADSIYYKGCVRDPAKYLHWLNKTIIEPFFNNADIKSVYTAELVKLPVSVPTKPVALTFALTIADAAVQSNNLDFTIFAELMRARGFVQRQHDRSVNLLYCAKIAFIKKDGLKLYESAYFTPDDTYRHAAISSLIRKDARDALGSRYIWKILNRTRKLMPTAHELTYLSQLTARDYGKYIAKIEGTFLQTGIFLLDAAGIAALSADSASLARGGNIMEYVHNPLIVAAGPFAGRKFHIRSYIMFSNIGKTTDNYYEIAAFVPDDLFRIYTAGETYRENGVVKPFSVRTAHITGAATTIHTTLESFGLDTAKIYANTVDVTRAAAHELLDVYRNKIPIECYDADCGFFIVALDVLIDEDYNAHILEINENPAFRPFRLHDGNVYERFDMSAFYRKFFEYVIDGIARLFGMQTRLQYDVMAFHRGEPVKSVEFSPNTIISAKMKSAVWNGISYEFNGTNDVALNNADYLTWKASMLLRNLNW